MLSNLPFTIEAIHKAYHQGESVEDLVNEALARLAKINDDGIYLHIANHEQLAEAIEELGPFDPLIKPLWGIPFAVKDNIDVAGMPTTAACPEFSYNAKNDAHVVALLKQAGAVVMGKTNLDQFATGLVGVRTPYQAPLNAINSDLVPGGSSSGSAVAVAHGQVCFSLGTDTAGSGRIPAALNNIVGLKPTLGSISNRGVVPACRSLDTVSIFSLCVEDATQVYSCCRDFDPQDPFSRLYKGAKKQIIPARFTLGIPAPQSLQLDDTEQEHAYIQALHYWKEQGATLIEIDFTPFYEVAKLLYEGPWVAERLAALDTFISDHPGALYPVTDRIIQSAHQFSASDTFKARYRLQALQQEITPIFNTIDALCVPSMPGMVFKQDLESDPIGPNSRLGTYTNFVNLLDLCAITVPGQTRVDGLPSSITLIAPAGQDALIHSMATHFHQKQAALLGATEHAVSKLNPPETTTIISELISHEEIALAVVGAHMSGLPLNYQLADRGGRFLISTQTAPYYSLYKLGDEKPLRPGLIRDEQGQAIALEVWALPKKQFGEFIEKIPSPLSIGSISLADNQQVKGFLSESFGLKEAVNITPFGGWRAFCHAEGL